VSVGPLGTTPFPRFSFPTETKAVGNRPPKLVTQQESQFRAIHLRGLDHAARVESVSLVAYRNDESLLGYGEDDTLSLSTLCQVLQIMVGKRS
jgi:hypothetical protein